MSDEKNSWVIYGQPIRGRSCGSCKLCCTILPVDLPRGKKLANEKCEYLCSKGCSIYENRPGPCRYFNCRWLFDERTGDMRRPDKVGYVIDPMLDGVVINGVAADVIQVWVDPTNRDAHRDPYLRHYLFNMAEIHGFLAIIRFDSKNAMFLVPPQMNIKNEWVEIHGDKMTMIPEDEMKKIYNQAVNGEFENEQNHKHSEDGP